MEKVFVLPGEFKFCAEPTHITTVLGSCVSICLYDEKKQQGGLNHYMLPEPTANLEGGKIAGFATKSLLKEAMMARSQSLDLRAEIYGGGKVITSFNEMIDIGERNIQKAKDMLTDLNIPFKLCDVGGTVSRRIVLDTQTGQVKCTRIERSTEDAAQHQRRVSLQKPRVLVVDDSSMVRKIVTRAIAESGRLEVCGEAGDAYEAREKIIELDPDVLCLDIMMPKMDGLEFLKRIMYFKPIPTVILSTLVREGNQLWDNLKKAGALHMVNKDDLQIYNGVENLQQVLIPKLALAARTLVYQIKPPGRA